MRKIKSLLAMAALGGMLAIGGCSGDQSDIVKRTQEIATQVCSFVPTAETIINILNLKNPLLQSGTDIANAICSAVGPNAAPRVAPGGPKVGGIPIKGERI